MSLPLKTRRTAVALAFIAIVAIAAALVVFPGGHDLKTRSSSIPIGMPRSEVEGLLGRPYMVLNRQGAKGELSVWIDPFWQVDVVTDPTGRVESVRCVPSDSLYRRTVGRVTSFPN